MFLELLCVLCLTGLTAALHAAGTFGVLLRLVWFVRHAGEHQTVWIALRRILWVVGALLLLHWFEAATWATFYWGFGVLPDFETAMYFSLTSYTTLGYGDIVLPQRWRLVGPFEAAVGILMFGWSTGVMVAAISRIYSRALQAPEVPPAQPTNEPPAQS